MRSAPVLFILALTSGIARPAHRPAAPPVPPAVATADSVGIEMARTILRSLMDEAGVPGLSVAVARDGRIVWSEAFGLADVERRSPATRATRFRIGSVSKSLTSAALLTLVEDGRVGLDEPVRTWVPEFPDKGAPITSRQLAGHLSGIRHYGDDDFISYRAYDDVVDALSVFASDSLLSPPGTAYHYSTFGYSLLGAVIQRAAGEPFLSYMQRAVFDPLGMTRTVADHVDSIIPDRASWYRRDGVLLNAAWTDNSYKVAGGGFLSTAEDLVRFGSALLSGGLLSRASTDLLFTSQRTASGEETGYGMGWRPREDWDGRPVVHHGGNASGGRAFILMYPEAKLVIAILANLEDAPIFEQEAQTIAHFFLETHPVTAGDQASVGSLAGDYAFPATVRGADVTVRLALTGTAKHPGEVWWEGADPLILTVADAHSDRVRLVGAGRQGVVNLWLSRVGDRLEGRWDWFGRTEPVTAVPPAR